ncbi:EAL domain-containing protein [Bradyrhizobium sp. dw_411]|uniref:bifunctional diguanylate cyclase/phosphodiesterase n=1 Tax=Bradyrhizobium sp. dw_411 TaxID=2720082 RepID=UPI001BCC8283|nr:EAL domain-containing protein [Bradyrhizobium sp. dw_411]
MLALINRNATVDPENYTRGNPIHRLIAAGLFLMVGIAVGTAIMIGSFRERALKNSERQLENTAQLLAVHFEQLFRDFDAVQMTISRQIQAGFDSPEIFKQQMSGEDTHIMLMSKISAYTDLAGITVFDADGQLINSSEVWPVANVNVSDRNYFKAFKAGIAPTQTLIELLHSRISHQWSIVVSHALVSNDGSFLGVISRGIGPANLEAFLATVSLADGEAISIVHRDGTLLARYPHIDAMIGRSFKQAPVFQQVLSHSDHGTIRLTSTVDGKDRIAAIQSLANFPLSVIAASTVSVVLSDWYEQVQFLVIAAALSMLVIAGILGLIVRQLSRQHQFLLQKQALEKQRLDIAVNNMTHGLLLFDSSARLVIWNQRYVDMYGMSPDVLKRGANFRDIATHRKQMGSFEGDIDEYCAALQHDKLFVTIITTAAGRIIQIANNPVAGGGWVCTHEDITERKQSDQRIAHMAHHDALTNLPNRVLFREHLERQLVGIKSGEQLAVLYLDVDEFKSINDSLGHMVGDELLKAMAAALSSCVRGHGFVARLGGDEFAIVQPAISGSEEVTRLVTRIYEAIRRPYECLGHQLVADASIGIALAPEHGTDLDQILKNADLAMYSAKAAGRRTHRFFEADMDTRAKARRALELDMRQAIVDGGFELHYQPIVSLQDNTITGCEALLRWRHPELGMISPVDFVPVAEETGLINQLGEWVLFTACAEAATWPDGLKVAINVSPVQFKSSGLALRVVEALGKSGLAANRLELEITEAVLIRDDDAALAILHQLRAIGVRIALDDFGTGYSSLSYLQRFPFDKIKIDRCFVSDITEPGVSSCIVQAVVNIAAARDMTTTAEGIETEQQRELLRALGCTEMQGWLFSAAKPAAELKQLICAHRARKAA